VWLWEKKRTRRERGVGEVPTLKKRRARKKVEQKVVAKKVWKWSLKNNWNGPRWGNAPGPWAGEAGNSHPELLSAKLFTWKRVTTDAIGQRRGSGQGAPEDVVDGNNNGGRKHNPNRGTTYGPADQPPPKQNTKSGNANGETRNPSG